MNNNSSSQSRISIRGRNSIVNAADRVDWHPADIKAVLEKRGLTLSAISRNHGYHPSAAGTAIRLGWPEVERIIAEALAKAHGIRMPEDAGQ